MIRAILRKDLALQSPVIAPALGLSLMLMLASFGRRLVEDGQVVLNADAVQGGFCDFVCYVLPLLAVLLARQLVVPELRDGGWVLLRRLPVDLGLALVAKGGVALILCTAILACAVALGGSLLRLSGDLGPGQVEAMFVSGLAWLALSLATGLAWASAGRWRLTLAAGGALAVAAWPPALTWLSSWPPATLLAEEFGLGWGPAVYGTWAMALGVFALTVIAWRAGRGAWLGALRGPTSAGDRGRSVALVALLMLVLARPSEPSPALRGAVAVAGRVTVRVVSPGAEAEARRRAGSCDAALESFGERLGISQLLPADVAIDHSAELPLGVYQRAAVSGAGGLLVRANLDPLDEARAWPWLIGEALDQATFGRLRADPWRWLLDGVPGWCGPSSFPTRLQVAWAARRLAEREGAPAVGPGLLKAWGQAREALGDPLAAALAAWILRELDSVKPGACAALLGEVARARAAGSWRATPAWLAQRFEAQVGRTVSEFERLLAGRLPALSASEREVLRALEPAPLDLEALASDGGVRLAVRGSGRVTLFHTLAGDEVAPRQFRRDEGDASRSLVTDVVYPPGAVLRVASGRWVEPLQCEVVDGWRELRLP